MVKVVRKKSGLAFGIANSGYSLIELLIALLILSIMITVAVPRFLQRGTTLIDDTVEHINRLTRLGYVRALMTGTLHRVVVSMNTDAPGVRLEEQVGSTSSGAPTFEAVHNAPVPAQYAWDAHVSIKNFFIKRIDEALSLQEAWFYIFPAGLSQEIIMNIVDEENRTQRSLVLNPFSVKFTVYDEFKTP